MEILKKIFLSGAEVWPIIEGGKGIGVSDGRTCGAFAAADAVGTFSGVNAKLLNEFGEVVPLVYSTTTRRARHEELMQYSIKAAISQAKVAHDLSKGRGRIHMNVLWEMAGVQRILHGVLEKTKHIIHGITCGAGMPYKLGEIASYYNLYYYPIVSSARALKALWQRSYKKCSKFLGGVVYEDPWLAGGHNGLSNKEDPNKIEAPYERVKEIRSFMKTVGLGSTVLIMAGGVWRLKDWEGWINDPDLAPIAFQFGTRPLLTKESPISPEWKKKLLFLKKDDVMLHRFSPTGFFSSAIKNNFLLELIKRSERQIPFSLNKELDFLAEMKIGPRARSIFVKDTDKIKAETWINKGYNTVLKTPDKTVIFLTSIKAQEIHRDQVECMGCLSNCKFSNWSENEEHTTGEIPDPRSFCIQKTLQNSIYGTDIENELIFSGHNAYKFGEDPFYAHGYIPTVRELVERIKQGD